ncbi:LysE family translocator [Streptomyces sp. NBC_00009]|uniref:LysE family translocator n=1 Tax=Streptomyces sp. NBC_00009 TaxID=2975620 RepID=UPI0032439D08
MPTHLPAFVATVWLLTMLPGAGQAVMVRQTLAGGHRRARATIAGNATGLLVWSTAAATGLSAVLMTNPDIYEVLRTVGGCVLVVLGVTTLRAARKAACTDTPSAEAERPRRWRAAFLSGLGTALGNPKAGVFAISVLPQFVTPDGPVLLSSLALGALWTAINVSWYLLFTWVVGRGGTFFSRPAVRRGLSIGTGVVLVLLGVGVAAGV